MKNLKTVGENKVSEVIEKKSRFIANIFYVENIQEVNNILNNINKKYNDARHNCYAYRLISKLGIIEKCSDDGEPTGTAGIPILNVLRKNDLVNVLIIITRYFGGILLGTGGLLRAYTQSSMDVVVKSDLKEIVEGYEVELEMEYKDLEKFKYYCKKEDIEIINVKYLNQIIVIIESTEEQNRTILSNMSKIKLKIVKNCIIRKKYISKNIDI